MASNKEIKPFNNCPALDGYHCQTNALAKIYHFYGHPLSEEMLFGLGAGLGFIYWKMKFGNKTSVFIGGRGNTKTFFEDIGRRTGVKIVMKSTSSEKKAEKVLLEKLSKKEPVMIFVDMGFLPWFNFPEEYHFGGHTIVICGYDGETVLASDIEQKGERLNDGRILKRGFYYPITLEQLRKARNSHYKPYPPKNKWLDFDFSDFHPPTIGDIYSSIKQTADAMLNPPIKNIGIKGIRHTAKEIKKWPKVFSEKELRENLYNLYTYIEIGGTGGGSFRYMYSRFLKESAEITDNEELERGSDRFYKSGKLFSEIGMLFENVEKANDLEVKISKAGERFEKIAEIEEDTLKCLLEIIQ